MRQAIATKFLGPTNSRGSRIKATAEFGSLTVAWDHRLGIEENHAAAAKALAVKLEWAGDWHGGALPGAGYCFVMVVGGQNIGAAFNIYAGEEG